MAKKPLFGELNSAEHSQEPESLEPKNLNGIDLIKKNNADATKPKIIKKILGPFKGVVFMAGPSDPTLIESSKDNSFLSSLFSKQLTKHRIYIPELHSHLPDLGDDMGNVPIEIASLYPFFVAQDTTLKPVAANTLVWCDFLDRSNFKDPIYLGPVDKEGNQPAGSSGGASSGVILASGPGTGDPIGGIKFSNSSGQVSYPAVTATSWEGTLPSDGYSATTATVADLVNLARQQIGKKEIPLGSDGGPEVDPFNGGRHEAWCAASMAWLFRQIGAPLPGDKIPSPGPQGFNNNHSVTYIQTIAQKLNSWYSEPQIGDMILYNTSGDPSIVNSHRHIGLVVDVQGDIIYTVEFNWSGRVELTKQEWKKSLFYSKDKAGNFLNSKYKIPYLVLGFARRPLPYSGIPDAVQTTTSTFTSEVQGGLKGFSPAPNVLSNGIDYSFGRPPPSDIVKLGYGFVMRYVPYGTGKDILKPELDSLLSAGLSVGFVFQRYGSEYEAGDRERRQLGITVGDSRAAGRAIATKARNGMRNLGLPDTVPVYFAIEAGEGNREVRDDELEKVRNFFRGIIEQFGGVDRVGMYGGDKAMFAIQEAGLASYFWQSRGWTRPRDGVRKPLYPFSNILQAGTGQVSGVSVDFNFLLKENSGLVKK